MAADAEAETGVAEAEAVDDVDGDAPVDRDGVAEPVVGMAVTVAVTDPLTLAPPVAVALAVACADAALEGDCAAEEEPVGAALADGAAVCASARLQPRLTSMANALTISLMGLAVRSFGECGPAAR